MIKGFRVGVYRTNPIITEGFSVIARQVGGSTEILVLNDLDDTGLRSIDVLLVDPYSSSQPVGAPYGVALVNWLYNHHPDIRVVALCPSLRQSSSFIILSGLPNVFAALPLDAAFDQWCDALNSAFYARRYFTNEQAESFIQAITSKKQCRRTPREIEVLNLTKQGFVVREIAAFLSLSPRTINTINAKMRQKYGVKNLALLEI